MTKKLTSLLGALLISACMTVSPALAANFENLVILHTNDTHGYDEFNADKGNIGMAAIAQVRDDLIAQGYDVLTLDAGDFSQDNNLVNYREGRAGVEFLNAVGYDVATLGNHEFDHNQQVLHELMSMADFSVVNCNITLESSGVTIAAPHVIVRKGDTYIGVIGATTPELKSVAKPANIEGLHIASEEELYARIQDEVDYLKDKCDLIIVLAHLGNEDALEGNRSKDVLANVHGIDIFVDGHDHQVVNEYTSDGTLLTETGSYTKNIGKITYQNGKWVQDFVKFDAGLAQKEDVAEIVNAEAEIVNAAMAEVIATTPFFLDGNRNPGVRTKETNLGDLVADAYWWQAKQLLKDDAAMQDTVVLQNGGGIRGSFDAGNITVGSVSKALPYSNTLYGIKVSGKTLLEIVEAATQGAPGEFSALPHVANMKYTVNTTVPYEKGRQYTKSVYYGPAKPGSRVTIDEIGGKPFDINKDYTIVCIDFLGKGGDTYAIFKDPGVILSLTPIGINDRDAFINYLKDGLGGVIPDQYKEPQGRITIIQ